jgi:predicted GNAT family acetyltransferase
MFPLTEINEAIATVPGEESIESNSVSITLLGAEHEAEVMAFLGERPTHTFAIASFIRNNGIVSPHNRGVFYGCRDSNGDLQGVALMGHFILFETRSDSAIEAFAVMAQTHKKVHMLLGEQEKVRTFWGYYHEGGQNPRLQCRELLFELRWGVEPKEPVVGLRLATRDDLDLVVPVHARSAFEESGLNPLDFDPEGFRERCARRIDKGQTWVWVEEGKLIFKAEIVADSPEVIYLEGVDVNPEERGKGYGSRCIAQLGAQLLTRTAAVLVLVNEKSPGAVQFYRDAGFRLLDCYDTIFLEKKYN